MQISPEQLEAALLQLPTRIRDRLAQLLIQKADETAELAPHRRSWLVGLYVLAPIGATETAVGQGADRVPSERGTVIGRVADMAGSPIAEADVVVSRASDSLVVAAGTTDSHGIARLSRVPPGGPYAVLVRKIGYKPAHTTAVYVPASDAVELSFVLQPYVAVLPEVTTTAEVPRAMARHGFLGIRLFKCFFIGFGAEDESGGENKELARATGCMTNRDAHAARRAARKVAGEVQRVTRRLQKAQRAGRRPDPTDALFVLNTAKTCNKDVPTRPPWPRPDPDVQCREIFNRIPRDTLARLGATLAAIDAPEPFADELRRRQTAEHRRVAEVRANKLAAMLADAEARYAAQLVHETAMRVDRTMKGGQPPDSSDARLIRDIVKACGGEVPEAPDDEVYCRAILKRTPRSTLERLMSHLATP